MCKLCNRGIKDRSSRLLTSKADHPSLFRSEFQMRFKRTKIRLIFGKKKKKMKKKN